MAGEIIPFGKYKGQDIEVVRARDPQYLQWLLQQAWFQEKFAPVYQIVVNNFAPASEDTPAHNALQVRFLEHDFREAFWLTANLVTDSDRYHLRQNFEYCTRHLRCAPQPFAYHQYLRKKNEPNSRWMRDLLVLHRARVRKQWAVWRKVRSVLPIRVEIGQAKFEDVTDVVFNVALQIGIEGENELTAYRGYRLGIEIKPSMGDDYPAVLRQIKRQRSMPTGNRPSHWFLLVDEFAASAVTLDQVRQIFAQDDIRVVLMAELRAKFE